MSPVPTSAGRRLGSEAGITLSCVQGAVDVTSESCHQIYIQPQGSGGGAKLLQLWLEAPGPGNSRVSEAPVLEGLGRETEAGGRAEATGRRGPCRAASIALSETK